MNTLWICFFNSKNEKLFYNDFNNNFKLYILLKYLLK